MLKICSVIKNELKRYFLSPLAFVYLLAFLFLNASFSLYIGNFLERGEATLDTMFAFLPWIYLFFISGIAMRLWSEEFKSKTIIQLATLPVSHTVLVWGKFIAAWIFSCIGLFLTFPFIVTVNILGDPDNGVMLASYFAAFLLSGAMLAIAQTASALTKNQIIALIFAGIINLLFFLSGIEYVLGFFRKILPEVLVENIADLSFLSHFDNICQGNVGLWDILFFLVIIVIFNIITTCIIQFRTSGITPLFKTNNFLSFILLLVFIWLGFAGINMLGSNFLKTTRFDVTEDSFYTIPDTAKMILSDIQEPVTVKIYYSTILSQRHPAYRKAINYLTFLMKNYQEVASDRFSYRIYFPQTLNRAEDMAIQDKIAPIPLPDLNQNAYFGISIVNEAGKKRVIPLIPIEYLDKIGQDILQNIYNLSHTKPTVGILSSLPIFGLTSGGNTLSEKWAIIEEIEKTYHIKQIKEPDDLFGIHVLWLIHPQQLSKELTEAIGAYTISGGKILVMLDVATEAQRLYSPTNQDFTPSYLNGLERLWGFEYMPQAVIGDLTNSITVNTGTAKRAYYTQDIIQFKVPRDGLNQKENITANLSSVLLASATPIEHTIGHNSTFIPLLQSSSNSALIPAEVIYQNLNPAELLPQFKADGQRKTIAAKIIGNDLKYPFEIVVIGDTDLIYNDFWSKFQLLEDHKYLLYLNDNANFILNALDDLSGQNLLIPLRRNIGVVPQFDRWELLRKENAVKIAIQERSLLAKISDVKQQLNDLWQKKNFENRQDFSDDELATLSQFRTSLQNLKQQLSELQIRLNANLQKQKNYVVFAVLYAIPLLLIIIAIYVVLSHQQHPKYFVQKQILFNKSALCLILCSLLMFISGLSVALVSFDDGNIYENKPVFQDWQTQLNNLNSITLKQQNNSLTFVKRDGLWYIQGYEKYPVYQRRIINFLATIANAQYLEKKSARAEYLSSFGLDSAHMTAIQLKHNNQTILQFDIGKYDEEIGRGGRGAYLKFENKFQVWLINADFISLSTNWRDWTLNTALNPRFGLVADNDKIKDQDVLILLLSELQNTPLTLAEQQPKELTTLSDIHLTFENKDDLTIFFMEHEGHYYIRYLFGKTEGDYLKLWASHTQDNLYEIPTENMEKIKDVFDSLG